MGKMKTELKRPALQQIEAVFSTARAEGRRVLYEFEVYQILNVIGLATPRYFFCERAGGRIGTQTLAGWGGDKLVIKVVSPADSP